ncbi:MAG: hypothetical protein H0T84_02405 [Tatlockia sp.]|nr:hypothetical protein [Tatlockia sp.]
MLSSGEKEILAREYDNLSFYLNEAKHSSWLKSKEEIIKFCVDNSIRLYNVVDLKQSLAMKFVQELLEISTEPLFELDEIKAKWLDKVRLALAKSQETFNLTGEAYISIGHQYLKTNKVSVGSLLTQIDMTDLFQVEKYKSTDVITTPPFSLTEMSINQQEQLMQELKQPENEEKVVFLPASHDGHWFYLQREEGTWSLQDSEPYRGDLSPRQKLIMNASASFLAELHSGLNYGELLFETSCKQTNDYDCGTQVLNAYRKTVNNDYRAKNHVQVLEEVFMLQVEDGEFSAAIESKPLKPDFIVPFIKEPKSEKEFISPEKAKKIEQIITTTASTQASPDREKLYKENLRELISSAVSQGLFAKVVNKIDLELLELAEADQESNESDESFATRLQEAEFRKAGL